MLCQHSICRHWVTSAALIAATAALCVARNGSAAAAPLTVIPSAKQVGRYEKITFRIPLVTAYRNPYDPAEVDLHLDLTTPRGSRIDLPAFYTQPYQRQTRKRGGRDADWLYPAGKPVWLARFAPAEIGTYTCVAHLRDRNGKTSSAPVTFACVPSQSHGFLRASHRDPRFLAFDDGTPFFAIGQDVAFIGPSQYVNLARADRIFHKLGENGANFLRVWACCSDWAMAVEARKSAWTRSWEKKTPVVPVPGGGGEKCVELHGAPGASLSVSPPNPVALKPDTRYIVSGRIRAANGAGIALDANGRRLGAVVTAPPGRQWFRFQREWTTSVHTWWLTSMHVRLRGAGTVWLRGLSLKEVEHPVELLGEADVNRPVLGVYNQTDCFMLDQIVSAAEKNGIYLQICLLTRDLYMKDLRNKNSTAYNNAIRHAEQTLRYAVARWGYSTHVAAWEYWNEMNPGLPTGRFYTQVGRYVAETDPYHHLRTTSAWGPAPRDWHNKAIDIAELHWYLRPNRHALWKDAAGAALDRARFLRKEAPDKPALLAEFGLANAKWGLSPYMKQDRGLVHFHNALWASALSGLSGTTMFWWWGRLDEMNAYPQYRPLAEFLKDIPFTASHLRSVSATCDNDRVRIVGLQGDDGAYLWLQNRNATWWRIAEEKISPSSIAKASLAIAGLRGGTYRVQWWDTRAGKALAPILNASARSGTLHLAVPPFAQDVAVKVSRK